MTCHDCCECCCECDAQLEAAWLEAGRRARALERAITRDGRLTFPEWEAAIDARHDQYGDNYLARAARVWEQDARERLRPPPMVDQPREAGRGRLGGYTTAAAAVERRLAEQRTAAYVRGVTRTGES